VKKAWISTLAILRDLGHNIKPVNMPSTRHAVSSYYIIALAEASSNLAKYDGIQFGPHILAISKPANGISPSLQSVVAARERGFGKEVRRRILLGSYSLTSEYGLRDLNRSEWLFKANWSILYTGQWRITLFTRRE
jgi:aspartyl-tRNA(Asn)/glutamyl-tRNA(Gln) amidotransferase subunit A